MEEMEQTQEAKDTHNSAVLDSISKIFNIAYILGAVLLSLTVFVVNTDNRAIETAARVTTNTQEIKNESARLTKTREETIAVLNAHTEALKNLVDGQKRIEEAVEAIRRNR